jgi:hypothetical protein
MMELDELKLAWQALDRRLEQQAALDTHVFRRGQLDGMRSELRPLAWGQVIQLFAGATMALVFAPFWVAHRETLHLLMTGLLLHLYALMLIVSAARNLYLINRIDYAAPVLSIQRALAELRAWRLRETCVFGAIGCVIWVPFLLYVFALLGADLYLAQPAIVAIFIGCAVVCLALFGLIARAIRRRSIPWARNMEDSAAGRSVRRARERLEELARFEQD